jgi:hypothetical protein
LRRDRIHDRVAMAAAAITEAQALRNRLKPFLQKTNMAIAPGRRKSRCHFGTFALFSKRLSQP